MKIPARVVIPIVAAFLLAGGLLAFAWWQLQQSQDVLRQNLQRLGDVADFIGGSDINDDSAETNDVILIRLREGDLYALQGDWAAAEREYQASVDAGGGTPALRKLAQAQMQRRNIPAVKETIEELKRQGARAEDLLLLQTIVFLRTGEIVQAQTLLTTAPDSPQKHYGLALIAIIQGNADVAKTELQAVNAGWDPTLRAYARVLQSAYDEFALFPESKPIHLTTLLARALAQVQECELALPLLSRVVTEQEDYRDAWMVQGYCELTTERAPEALSSFQRAYAIDPEKPEIQYFLGRAYSALEQWKSAATFYQYAVVNGFEPKKEVRRRLADAALKAEDKALAYEQLKGLLSEPDADIDVHEETVALGIELQKSEEAYQFALGAVKKWPQVGKAHELLGWSALETGRRDEARTELERALQLDGTLTRAREKLGQL